MEEKGVTPRPPASARGKGPCRALADRARQSADQVECTHTFPLSPGASNTGVQHTVGYTAIGSLLATMETLSRAPLAPFQGAVVGMVGRFTIPSKNGFVGSMFLIIRRRNDDDSMTVIEPRTQSLIAWNHNTGHATVPPKCPHTGGEMEIKITFPRDEQWLQRQG